MNIFEIHFSRLISFNIFYFSLFFIRKILDYLFIYLFSIRHRIDNSYPNCPSGDAKRVNEQNTTKFRANGRREAWGSDVNSFCRQILTAPRSEVRRPSPSPSPLPLRSPPVCPYGASVNPLLSSSIYLTQPRPRLLSI